MRNLVEFPQDILLELAKWLDIHDILSLLSTCRAIRELQWHKSLWIYAIWRIRSIQLHPLPLQNSRDLSSLSLPHLVDAVKLAHRLMDNLRQQVPTPASVTQFHAGWLVKGVICIPGTYLLLVQSFAGISCWDVLTSQSVASLPRAANVSLAAASQNVCMQVPGKALIIGYTQSRVSTLTNLVAIWLDFTDRSNITLTSNTSPDISDVSLMWRNFFVSKDGMGLVTSEHLVYWSFEPNTVVVQPHDHPLARQGMNICHLRYGDVLYGFDGGTGDRGPMIDTLDLAHLAESARLPNQRVQLDTVLKSSHTILPLSLPDPAPDGLFGASVKPPTIPVSAPDYGVFLVTCSTYEDYLTRSCLCFWPATSMIADDDEPGTAACFERTGNIQCVAVGSSGRYVLFLGHGIVRPGIDYEANDYLGLVHFRSDDTFKFSHLDIGELNLRTVKLIAFDDTLGLVVAVDIKGMLTAVSYSR
ncbi:hypothetical protein C8F01DRAFT_1157490, partial [Mycena amicta]